MKRDTHVTTGVSCIKEVMLCFFGFWFSFIVLCSKVKKDQIPSKGSYLRKHSSCTSLNFSEVSITYVHHYAKVIM